MATSNYATERERIATLFSQHLNIWEDDFMTSKFNLVSAGLSNYLPHIDYNEHQDIFRNILMHECLSKLEQAHQEALDYVACENLDHDKLGLLKKGGTIICTFHTGSYRIINQVLIKNKIPFSLVIAKSVMDSQGGELTKIYERLSGDQGTASFGLIDAESPGSGLRMLREIKKGSNLVLYIDGNTGAGDGDNEKSNLCDIRFLGQRIFARKGIAFLAHVARSPILTVACYRKSIDDIRLQFFDPICACADEERETFAHIATQKIYDLVAPVITKYPDQWEAWMYLHKVAHIVNPGIAMKKKEAMVDIKGDARLMLNSREFGVIKVHEDGYLFKKSGYVSFAIDKEIYDLLSRSVLRPVMKKEMDPGKFSQFYENNVVITV